MNFSSAESVSKLTKNLDKILIDCVDKTSNVERKVNGVAFGVTNEKETVYLNAAGVRDSKSGEPFEKDTRFCFWSTTKSIASIGVLQLIEKKLITLDDPAGKYLPLIDSVKLLKGWNSDGTPNLVVPKNKITVRHLLTHTAGFSYSFFSEDYLKELKRTGQPDISNITEETLKHAFLLFEPGTDWTYGHSIDFAGVLLEAVTGETLGAYLEENVFRPAKMNCSFTVPHSDKDRLLAYDRRQPDGTLKRIDYELKNEKRLHMAGHGLYGTVEDYLKYIRIIINEGKTPDGVEIIKKETWELAVNSITPEGLHVKDIHSSIPELSKSVPINPDAVPDLWTASFCKISNDAPTGRPKGSFNWSGLANLHFWIDIENKIGGYYATHVFPFAEASIANFTDLEAKTYQCL